MKPTIEELKQNYEKLDEEKLIRIATEEANDLRPEAVEALKEVLKKRGLDNVLKGIEIQLREIDEELLLKYCELLRSLPCPKCNSTKSKLNATVVATVESYLIMTNYEKELQIACPNCLKKLNDKAILHSALLGWWGIPWGIVRTIQAIILNIQMKNSDTSQINDLFVNFVYERIGRIEANINNKNELMSIIKDIR